MTKLILVRHAESEANVNRAVTSTAPGPGRSAFGRKQAEALIERFAGETIRAIRCSPALRARDTARPLAEHLGLLPEESDDLLEISCGSLEGHHTPEAFQIVVDVYNAWFDDRREMIIPDGETFQEVQERMLRGLPSPDELPADGATLVVGHGGSLRVAVNGLAGEQASLDAGFLGNAAHMTLVAAPDGSWSVAEAPSAVIEV